MTITPEPWIGDIVAVLDRTIGFDPASIGADALHHSIRAAYGASGFADPAAFVAAVQQDERHRQALIERVVVPETCFLRDRGPFEFLSRYALQWLRTHSSGVLRALSAPCATGEEAYSIAITLLEAGVPRDRFVIDAVDVSERLLDHARQAVYQESALRRCPPDIRERYFLPVERGVIVSDEVRRHVRFERRNLVGAGAGVPAPPYDVVFCRNLLIYLHPPARQAIRRLIDESLAADGVLIVGHAEVMPMCDGGLFSVADCGAFALIHAVAHEPSPAPPRSHPPQTVVPLRPVPRPPVAAAVPARAVVPAAVPRPDLIEQARTLADQGRLDEARRICERVMAERGPSDATYFLIGVIDQAEGRLRESEDALRKALYLNPEHRDALLQLAVVHDRQGNRVGADRLRRRAARAEQTEKK